MTVVAIPSAEVQSTLVPFKLAVALSICNSDVSGDDEVLKIRNTPRLEVNGPKLVRPVVEIA